MIGPHEGQWIRTDEILGFSFADLLELIDESMGGEARSGAILCALNDCAIRRPLQYIRRFMGYDARLHGNGLHPVVLPVYLRYVKDLLETTQIATFKYYLSTPYNANHLLALAWADYIYVAKEWDGLGESLYARNYCY